MKHYQKLLFIGLVMLTWLYAVPAMAAPLAAGHTLPVTATYNETTGELIDTATYIYAETYKEWTELVTVSLPNATYIGADAFHGCDQLTSISAPEATGMGIGAFRECTSLANISMDKMEKISAYAFFNCDALTTVRFPAATEVGGGAFSDKVNTRYDSINGTSVIDPATQGLLAVVDMPKLTSINDGAFENCSNLTSFTFDKVTNINSRGFFGCTALTTVIAPNLASISYAVFSGCTALENISMPKVNDVQYSTFANCSSLQALSLPLATSFDPVAVSGCTALSSLQLDSLIELSDSIPAPNLEKLAIPSLSVVGQDVSQYCSNLKTLVVGTGFVKTADENSVPNNAQLTVYTPTGTKDALRTRIAGSTLYKNISEYDAPILKDVIFFPETGGSKSCVIANCNNTIFYLDGNVNERYASVDVNGIVTVTNNISTRTWAKKLMNVGGFIGLQIQASCLVQTESIRATAPSLNDGSIAIMLYNTLRVYTGTVPQNNGSFNTITIYKSDYPTFSFRSYDDEWWEITYGTHIGYLPKPAISTSSGPAPSVSPTPGTAYGMIAAGTVVYANPDNRAYVLGMVNSGGTVIILGQVGNYYCIRVGNVTGYVLKSSITNITGGPVPTLTPSPSSTPQPTYTPRPTYAPQPIRNPGNGGNNNDVIITPPSTNTSVENGVQMKVKINGVETEVILGLDSFSYDYATPETVTAITGFKLRKGPDAAFGTYRSVRKGEKLTIIGRERDWLKVDMGNGKVAYILEDMTTK